MTIQKINPISWANLTAMATAIFTFLVLLLFLIFGSILGGLIGEGLGEIMGGGGVMLLLGPNTLWSCNLDFYNYFRINNEPMSQIDWRS